MDHHKDHILTLANSIIGVSILAMPYCFKQCGILLAIAMLLFCNLLTRLTCHYLIKSAIIARRRNFEYLAFYIFGSLGKFAIEIGIIGFLIGTCIAFFVIMGDLGPEIICEITGKSTSSTMRTSILMAIALFCVLPLGLLRNVDSLSSVSSATIGFYCCLILKIVLEALPHLFSGDWINKVDLWKTSGILQCLPIFSMALSCQTQLFEIYQVIQTPTLEKMNHLVKFAVNICTFVYLFVGLFGYIAAAQKPFTGNILLSFAPSFASNIMKIGFILSVAFSFPLVIFPCRASLYSLLYKEGYTLHESINNYIPESKFKAITLFIVFTSLVMGILIPNIEFVLGLVGSTIGVMICLLFPVACFLCVSEKNTSERQVAKIVLVVGLFLMVLGTYENLQTLDNVESPIVNNIVIENRAPPINPNIDHASKAIIKNVEITTSQKLIKQNFSKVTESPEVRHEPPQPIESIDINEPAEKKSDKDKKKEQPKELKLPDIKEPDEANKSKANDTKNDEVDIEAIKKDDREMQLQVQDNKGDAHNILIDSIKKQKQFQEEIVREQKKLIEVFQEQHRSEKVDEVKVKAVKKIESIALEAIERISGNNNEVKKDIAEHIEEKIKKVMNGSVNITNTKPVKKIKEQSVEEQKLNVKQLSELKHNALNASQEHMPKKHDNNSVIKPDVNKSKNKTAPLLQNLGQESSEKLKAVPIPLVINNTNPLSKKDDIVKEVKSENDEKKFVGRDILAHLMITRK